MIRKSRVTIEGLNTLHDVPAIELKFLISDLEFLMLKRWAAGQFRVDNVIELIDTPK
jgi:hypothetical protein